jgi:hypothetical protein
MGFYMRCRGKIKEVLATHGSEIFCFGFFWVFLVALFGVLNQFLFL